MFNKKKYNNYNKEENELVDKSEPGNIQNQPKQCKHKYKEWNLRIHTG